MIVVHDRINMRHRLFWVATFGLTCLALWLPFGFSLTAVLEEWGVLAMFTNHGTFFVASADSPLPTQRLRPLTILPHAIAYSLTPDSFDLWNVWLIGALMVKGMAAALIGERVTNSRRWGLVYGLLVLLYPADTMQMSFRALHINVSLALVLLGSALLVRLEGDDSLARRLATSIAAAAMLLVAVAMYEAAAPIALMPFLVWYVRGGFRGTSTCFRSLAMPAMIWLGGIVVFAGYVLVSSRAGETTYQQSLTNGNSLATTLLFAIPKLLEPGLIRSLLGGWVDAWLMTRREVVGYAWLVLAAVLVGMCVLLGSTPSRSAAMRVPDASARGRIWRMVVVGVVLVILGFAPYAISPAHVAITQRTYLFAAPGGALVLLAVLLLVGSLFRWLPAPLVAVLFGLGIAAQWVQFRHYVAIAEQQRSVLRHIVENFDGELDGRTLVVKDLSGRLGHLWMLRDHLGMALTWLYGKPIGPIEICLTTQLDWQRLDDLGRPGRCIAQADGWTFRPAPPVTGPGRPLRLADAELVVPTGRAHVIEIEPDGQVVADPALAAYRARLATGDDVVARRYRGFLAQPHANHRAAIFKPDSPEVFRWSFGNWWNLDLPTRGSGWREADWKGIGLQHYASAWKNEAIASLIFDLKPAKGSYRLVGRLEAVLDQKVKDSVVTKINGRPLPLTWIGDAGFWAPVGPDYLFEGVNTLSIESSTRPEYFGLSLSVQAIVLAPD